MITTTYTCDSCKREEEELRKYIADGKKEYKVSRTIAADFVSQRIKEMMNSSIEKSLVNPRSLASEEEP